jgi:hypothetical protein
MAEAEDKLNERAMAVDTKKQERESLRRRWI